MSFGWNFGMGDMLSVSAAGGRRRSVVRGNRFAELGDLPVDVVSAEADIVTNIRVQSDLIDRLRAEEIRTLRTLDGVVAERDGLARNIDLLTARLNQEEALLRQATAEGIAQRDIVLGSIAGLRAQIAASRAEADRLNRVIADLQQTIAGLRRDLATAVATIAALEAERERIRQYAGAAAQSARQITVERDRMLAERQQAAQRQAALRSPAVQQILKQNRAPGGLVVPPPRALPAGVFTYDLP